MENNDNRKTGVLELVRTIASATAGLNGNSVNGNARSKSPVTGMAEKYLRRVRGDRDPAGQEITAFIEKASFLSAREMERGGVVSQLDGLEQDADLLPFFHPEAAGIIGQEGPAETALRLKRKVTITGNPESPITNPGVEILFTSNVLLSPPAPEMMKSVEAGRDLSSEILKRAEEISRLSQSYWYDHPIPVGIKPENNEVLYGLSRLDQGVAFEKKRGNLPENAKVSVALSVSVTHEGLDEIAKEYLEGELQKFDPLEHLDVYVFGEKDTRDMIEQGLSLLVDGDSDPLRAVFGTNGEYGRHYSFLKAIAPLWQACMDPAVRGTFKIDLDQVFPQAELVKETGKSAFELLASPLWGGKGLDNEGKEIEMGMIAGALVNENDIGRGLFTPDVDFPASNVPTGEQVLFWSQYPQALSTRAEMMTRNGETGPIQRVHVTGGTNGILTETLKKHRPFTPTFIGRAEDQAYILSTFMNSGLPRLGYLHQPGLIMRHDKASFASDAIKAAAAGKQIGDYVRIILFSGYASLLPGGVKGVKKRIDPFTGSFVSPYPVTIALTRLLLKTETLLHTEGPPAALEFLKMGARRLSTAINFVTPGSGLFANGNSNSGLSTQNIAAETAGYESAKGSPMENQLLLEREGWRLYYECINALESGDPRAAQQKDQNPQKDYPETMGTVKGRLKAIIERCRLNTA